MTAKFIPALVLLSIISYYSYTTFYRGQTHVHNTILAKSQIAKSTSAYVRGINREDDLNYIIESNSFAVNLGKLLANAASIPTSARKYVSSGIITFHDDMEDVLKIDCFTHNTIKINGRFYVTSYDLLETAKFAFEEEYTKEELK